MYLGETQRSVVQIYSPLPTRFFLAFTFALENWMNIKTLGTMVVHKIAHFLKVPTYGFFLNRPKKEKQMFCMKRWNLCFALLFLAVIFGPFQFAWVSSKLKRTLFALAGTEPQDFAVILDIHHSSTRWEINTAKRAFSRFRHYQFPCIVCLLVFIFERSSLLLVQFLLT